MKKSFFVSSLLFRKFVRELTTGTQKILRDTGMLPQDLIFVRYIFVGPSRGNADLIKDHFKTGDWYDDDGREIPLYLTFTVSNSAEDYNRMEVINHFYAMINQGSGEA